MKSRQVIVSWSGGKDSALCLQALRADPGVEVVGLLTSVTRDYDRVSIHGVRRSLLDSPGIVSQASRTPVVTNGSRVRSLMHELRADSPLAPPSSDPHARNALSAPLTAHALRLVF